ncbi:HFL061Cp [Eremothecium sinecaudum]|uniref:Mediator of RNA polymerase II transcription subunit 11 n=1 Tax=Eremothecium sinecaudum TaxID=45286 RepID=A0A109UZQ7_9SACH|nr:HFL061Cp [Eremothecium sinecaudum]AMD21795.1 HFL061Cp [Eremothecium sinecaudum]
MPQPEFVKERLRALDKIDRDLSSILHYAQQSISTLMELKRGLNLRPQFQQHVREYYKTLEGSTVALRNEIKLLDDAVGTQLLPINISKKAVGQDQEMMLEQFSKLEKHLG